MLQSISPASQDVNTLNLITKSEIANPSNSSLAKQDKLYQTQQIHLSTETTKEMGKNQKLNTQKKIMQAKPVLSSQEKQNEVFKKVLKCIDYLTKLNPSKYAALKKQLEDLQSFKVKQGRQKNIKQQELKLENIQVDETKNRNFVTAEKYYKLKALCKKQYDEIKKKTQTIKQLLGLREELYQYSQKCIQSLQQSKINLQRQLEESLTLQQISFKVINNISQIYNKSRPQHQQIKFRPFPISEIKESQRNKIISSNLTQKSQLQLVVRQLTKSFNSKRSSFALSKSRDSYKISYAPKENSAQNNEALVSVQMVSPCQQTTNFRRQLSIDYIQQYEGMLQNLIECEYGIKKQQTE